LFRVALYFDRHSFSPAHRCVSVDSFVFLRGGFARPMRSTLALFGALCISGIIAAWGCSDGSSATTGASIIADGSAGPSADAGTIDPAGSGGGAGLEPAPCFGCGAPPPPDASADTAAQVIESMRIEPADATLLVTPGGTAVQPFRVLATFRGTPGERDITSRSVFLCAR